MPILVVNSGSSSVKFSMFQSAADGAEPRALYDGEVSGIGGAKARLTLRGEGLAPVAQEGVSAATAVEAIRLVWGAVTAAGRPSVEAVGYRVVHPGAHLRDHQRITDDVLQELAQAAAFAPLHDPAAIEVIREGMARFPNIAHYACFDTVFHQTMPPEASTYPIPQRYRDQGVRRYGFHGLSCESIVRRMRLSGAPLPKRMAIAHLGSGCSVTAVVDGASVDTTMGLTPTGGVMMGTRPGDLDPGLVLWLLRQQTGDAAGALETMLNHEAGMVALSGMANDVRAVRTAALEGHAEATLALAVFCRTVLKAIGGFHFLLGGLDAIVFAGGIGEHDPATRAQVLAGLEDLGVFMNSQMNYSQADGPRSITASDSATVVFIVPAEEDLMIALHVARMAAQEK